MARVFRYKGKLYSDDWYKEPSKYDGDLEELLSELSEDHPNIYHENTVVLRYIGDEYSGTTDEKSEEETVDEIIDNGYDEGIGLEAVND